MWTLGLSRSHNGAACLVHDGRVVVAVQLERLERIKRFRLELDGDHVGTGVRRAVNYCLRHAGIGFDEVDVTAVTTPARLPADLHWPYGELVWVPHHLAHAEYALHHQPALDGGAAPASCLVLVADGRGTHEADRDRFTHAELASPGARVVPGDVETVSAYDFDGHELRLVYRMCGRTTASGAVDGSLGAVWEEASGRLFGARDQAGKVMGLAGYGNPDVLEPVVAFDGTAVVTTTAPLHDVSTPYRHVAAGVQRQTTDAVLALVGDLVARTGRRVLAYAGGLALNVHTNEAVLRAGVVDGLAMNGSCEDNGTAVGAALAVDHARRGCRTAEPADDHLGRAYLPHLVEAELARFPLRVRRCAPEEVDRLVVDRVGAGALVGWFQGRSEFGPRALGHRSILAAADDPATPDRINVAVKHRERFRPFAAVVSEEHGDDHFDLGGQPSPSMLRSVAVTDDRLTAVTHVDGTCRVQTVHPSADPRLHRLLRAQGEQTGIPVLVNTSFNGPGEPIVESPADAALTLLRSDLDLLVVGDHVVERR